MGAAGNPPHHLTMAYTYPVHPLDLTGAIMQGHKAKTGSAEYKRVGHTTSKNFGQSDSSQERGASKSGSGTTQSYK